MQRYSFVTERLIPCHCGPRRRFLSSRSVPVGVSWVNIGPRQGHRRGCHASAFSIFFGGLGIDPCFIVPIHRIGSSSCFPLPITNVHQRRRQRVVVGCLALHRRLKVTPPCWILISNYRTNNWHTLSHFPNCKRSQTNMVLFDDIRLFDAGETQNVFSKFFFREMIWSLLSLFKNDFNFRIALFALMAHHQTLVIGSEYGRLRNTS